VSKTQEIRFAVVMYGGVSLCIYINGIAQELLRLVRSTAMDDTADDPVTAIYRRLSQHILDLQDPHSGQPVPTRFVIDLLSGTSAGGINAVFLAKALTVRAKNLDVLRDTWLRVADMAQLLNSKPDLFQQKRSLLRGQWMYEQLLDAFNEIDKPAQCDPATNYQQVRELDLFVTNTDLRGVSTPLRLADQEITERVHKGSFHFRFDPFQFPDPASAEKFPPSNHFQPEYNPLLAFAARCTSAFPIAFEPMRFRDIEKTIGKVAYAQQAIRFRRFFKWVPQNDSANPIGRPIAFDDRPLADGGYLDNKPFGHVIDALTYRANDRPHARKLLFVDPFPEAPTTQEPNEHIDFLTNARLAAMDLPRYETIRGDIERIQSANQSRRRLHELQDFLQDKNVSRKSVVGQATQIANDAGGAESEPASRQAADAEPKHRGFNLPLSQLLENHGLAYGSYHVIRVDSTTDDLARLLASLSGEANQDSLFLAIRYVTAEWRKARFSHEGDPDTTPPLLTESEFLSRFDYSFRLRLTLYLLKQSIQSCDLSIRQKLLAQLTRIRRRARTLREIQEKNPLSSILSDLYKNGGGLTWAVVKDVLIPKAEADRIRKAQEIYLQYQTSFDSLADAIHTEWRAIYKQNGIENKEILAACPHLAEHYKTFDRRDMLSLTYLEGSDVSEHASVEIHRISPDDGIRLAQGQKLAGYAAADFGAFLHRPWRENDILWGRLDAASQILSALLPYEHQKLQRDAFLEELQFAIVAQESKLRQLDDPSNLASFLTYSPQELGPALRSKYKVPPPPPNHQLLDQLASATQILGRMIEDDIGSKSSFTSFLKSAGVALAGIVGFLTPGFIGRVFTMYWLQLFLALGAMLWFLGSVLPEEVLLASSAKAMAQLGKLCVAVCVGLFLTSQAVGKVLAGTGLPSNVITRNLRWVLVWVLILLCAIGIWKLPEAWKLIWPYDFV
jgi:patatin-related protein